MKKKNFSCSTISTINSWHFKNEKRKKGRKIARRRFEARFYIVFVWLLEVFRDV
jgi:hypothetical protein